MSVARDATGTILVAVGIVCFAVGAGVSVTGIGAICGIPMILLAFIPMIWGMLMKSKATRLRQDASLQQSVNRISQIHAAAQNIVICSRCQTPNPNTVAKCSKCGTQFLPI